MKRLVCTGSGNLEWDECDEPELKENQVRVQPEFAAAKHGTEMAFFKGYGMHRGGYDMDYLIWKGSDGKRSDDLRAPVGNMVVGKVVEVGRKVEKLKGGDRVAAYGPFQDSYLANEGSCWKMPEGMSWKSAVCVDPADFAFGAVRDGHVRIGDAVAVFGLGAIGLMVIQFARLAGAEPVIGLDPLENRRKAAEELGITATLDPTKCDAGLELKKMTGKRGVDVAIEYSGATQALQQALRGVAYGGTVVAGAFPPPYDAGLDFGAEAHMNIPNLVFSRACSQPDRDHPRWDNNRIYDVCWRWLCEGKVTGDPIVNPVVPFEDLVTEYAKIATNPESNIKLGVEF